MEFFNFVMALSPIVVVLVGILAFHQSAKKVIICEDGKRIIDALGSDADSRLYVF